MQGGQDTQSLHFATSTVCETLTRHSWMFLPTTCYTGDCGLNFCAASKSMRVRDRTDSLRLAKVQQTPVGRSHSRRLFKEAEAHYSEMTCSFPLITNFTKDGSQAALIDSVSLGVPVPTSQAHATTAAVCSSNLGGLLWVLIQSGYSLLCVRARTVNHWAATRHVAQHKMGCVVAFLLNR